MMEWLCGWCGKPHAENDPPCDRCGHGTFERAVVREPASVDTGPNFVWRCVDCGRDHPKHSPPCSRCGSAQLERTKQHYEDVDRELAGTSWIAVAKPYTPVFVIAIVVGSLLATGVISVASLPGVGTDDPPLPDAPGSASEANGLDLNSVATSVQISLEEERGVRFGNSRAMPSSMTYIATYTNRAYMRQEYGDGFDPDGDVTFSSPCPAETVEIDLPLSRTGMSISEYESEDRLAEDIVDQLLAESTPADAMALDTEYEYEGIDVHVGPDGRISVAYVVC